MNSSHALLRIMCAYATQLEGSMLRYEIVRGFASFCCNVADSRASLFDVSFSFWDITNLVNCSLELQGWESVHYRIVMLTPALVDARCEAY
jgi:hypothetical protein